MTRWTAILLAGERPGGDPNDPTTSFGYAYQFDATRFAPFMRDWSEARGATRG